MTAGPRRQVSLRLAEPTGSLTLLAPQADPRGLHIEITMARRALGLYTRDPVLRAGWTALGGRNVGKARNSKYSK